MLMGTPDSIGIRAGHQKDEDMVERWGFWLLPSTSRKGRRYRFITDGQRYNQSCLLREISFKTRKGWVWGASRLLYAEVLKLV